jgi:ABC-2 type transport system permease protein
MIWTLIKSEFLKLKRDKVALVMTFLLPVGFFSIFALVFSGGAMGPSGKMPALKTVIADEDQSPASHALASALARDPVLRIQTNVANLKRADVERIVRKGDSSVGIVIPKGFGETFPSFGRTNAPEITVLADTSNPIASQLVMGLLQRAAMTAMPHLLARQGFEALDQVAILTPAQRGAMSNLLAVIETSVSNPASTNTPRPADQNPPNLMGGFLKTKNIDLLGEKKKQPMVAFYAAGIGVMFLLFSVSGGAGTILEDAENGVLDRMLSSRLGMNGLLLGKWLYLTILGAAQLLVMFIWGALVFKVELLTHLPGFFIMTAVTAAAASALALVLATASRTRAQLSGISTLVILGMSALGGSMFPRFIMSETMQKIGLLTFNGWALDGYLKVFWRELPLWELWPQVLVLSIATVIFLGISRALSKRWEVA